MKISIQLPVPVVRAHFERLSKIVKLPFDMILIIDDDIAVRTSLLLLFKNNGYSATVAAY